VLDMAGRFADLNASARSLLAAPSGELIGRSAGELLPPPWQSLLKTDHDLHVEVELGLGAKERTFDLRLLLLQDGRGRRTGRLIVLHDVTARKVMERDQARLIDELQTALAEVRTLSGLLPICANCKKIRDDSGYWHSVEAYVVSHSQAEFTHSICPECAQELYPEYTNETG